MAYSLWLKAIILSSSLSPPRADDIARLVFQKFPEPEFRRQLQHDHSNQVGLRNKSDHDHFFVQ